MNKQTFNTHIYLYAKYHYKRNDVIEDLKLIVEKTYLIGEPDTQDVISILLNLAQKYIQKNFVLFREFVNDISPYETWKVGYYTKESINNPNMKDYDFNLAVIYKCLSVIRQTTVKEIEEIEGLPLGNADFNLFPTLKPDKN